MPNFFFFRSCFPPWNCRKNRLFFFKRTNWFFFLPLYSIYDAHFPFIYFLFLGMLDLFEIGERVKSMDIVSVSQGNYFLMKSLMEKNVPLQIDLLEQVHFFSFEYLFECILKIL